MNRSVVLYVDDELEVIESTKIALESRGYIVLTAGSGQDGLEILKKRIPDVIITDLRMSPMNGFDFYQEVKKLPQCQKLPILFVTAVNDFLTQKYAATLGVNDYISKPVDLDVLDTAIKNKLSGK